MKHELKIWPEHFEAVWDRKKLVELRKDDREYQVDDELFLRCWNPETEEYTGSFVLVKVTHILRGGPWLADDYVAMSIRRM